MVGLPLRAMLDSEDSGEDRLTIPDLKVKARSVESDMCRVSVGKRGRSPCGGCG